MHFRFFLSVAVLVTVSACSAGERTERKAARIHKAALTMDSHTDTPMLLTRSGFDFMERHDPLKGRSKIDLPRMKEGGMDGVWFGVFVGQGPRTPEGNKVAQETALRILDTIDAVVGRNSGELEIATASGDLKRIAGSKKRAIYLGMENGYPVGNDLQMLDLYYTRGIRYITLCHSENNDICDSSTDTTEHGGLSPFGEQVVERMNDLGIMVDISHASDQSVLDILEKSRAPVIASHSCSRALCDNPRNLSDELLVKLKENGGVIQLCILSAYVEMPEPNPSRDSAFAVLRETYGSYGDLDQQTREEFEAAWFEADSRFPRKLATVSSAVDHIDHIVELIGIDHVGIGTDFDGGGALADCFDESQMGNITLELVRRGYSGKDIKKIWGGNLTRVMKEVEDAAKTQVL